VLLLSPADRILLIKYRNFDRQGLERPCWTTCGGGIEPGETIAQAAEREIYEETGIADVRLGPIVWYGEDAHRSGDWGVTFQEHFIVAHAPTEDLDTHGWTDHERRQIIEMRWWSLEELQVSTDRIYPFNLASLITPVLAGAYPEEIIVLPPI
jgi:ADP-ribose pyrophosphatase YjhB (NUDIX family)